VAGSDEETISHFVFADERRTLQRRFYAIARLIGDQRQCSEAHSTCEVLDMLPNVLGG
jgi:hypothetical protein